MRKLIPTALLCIVATCSFSQVKVQEAKKENAGFNNTVIASDQIKPQKKCSSNPTQVLPKDFPVFRNTGNKKEDLRIFHEAKQEWITNNPDRYKAISHYNFNASIESVETPKISKNEK